MVVWVTAWRAKLQIHHRKRILLVQKEHRAISERNLFTPPLLDETVAQTRLWSLLLQGLRSLYSLLDTRY